jgi:hypothetical protein
MSIDDVRASAIALLNAGAVDTPAFERLADEYGRLKARGSGEGVTEPKNKRRPPMAKKQAVKKAVMKGVNGKEVRRSGFGRGAASNWDAFGTVVKTKGLKLEDGVYQVKGGELRRMADTNGTGTVCVVYRVAAKGKVEEKPTKKTAAKKPEPKAAQKPATKKAEAKKPAKKEKKAEAKKPVKKEKKAEAKKGNAKKGK